VAMVTVDFFRNVEFFAGFDDDAVSAIAAQAKSTTYHRGDTIFAESDPAEELYIVASGRIAISNKSPEGRESVLALMGPGDLFGDMALFDGNGRSAGARALETSDVVSVPYAVLRARMENDPKALILPSVPRLPKPPGTRIASSPASAAVPSRSRLSESTYSIITRVRVCRPAWISASFSDL